MNINLEALPNFVRNAWLSISRDRGLTIASILVMTLTLFVISIFATVTLLANSVLGYLESRPQVTVFFKSDFPEEKVSSIGAQIRKEPTVASVNFVSKEDAFKFYLGQHTGDQSLLESVSSDIFPPALEVKTHQISELASIADQLSHAEGVDEVVFFKDVINTLNSWLNTIRFVGAALIAVLVLISLFIILITIGMSIRSRAEEIEIMRLLGATAAYINLPFLTQGAIYGFISGLISSSAIMIILPLSQGNLAAVFKGLPIPSLLTMAVLISFGQIVLGVVLGSLGAWVSTKRYIRI